MTGKSCSNLLPVRRACAVLLALALVLAAPSAWAKSDVVSSWDALDYGFSPPSGYGAYYVGSGNRDRATELELTADGRMVIAGYTYNGANNDLLVMRFLSDGSPDASFGDGKGYVVFGGPGNQMALGLALQSDQKIVVTGRTSLRGNNDVLTLRFNPDGSLDTSFGQQGIAIYSGGGGGTDTGRAVEIQSDGNILVAGELSTGAHKDAMVLRYLANGSLDPSFGQAGLATYAGKGRADDWAFDLALQPDGRILVTGGASPGQTEDIMLWRLNPNGATDQTFASGGVATWAGPGGLRDYGNAIALDQQGRILVAGADDDGQSYNMVLLGFREDGSLDPSFGQGGAAQYASAVSGYDYAWGLAVAGDGRILVSGVSAGLFGEAPTISCFLPNGTLDSSFANQGVFQLYPAGKTGRAYDLAVTGDGGVVSAGYLNDGNRDQVLLFRLNSQ